MAEMREQGWGRGLLERKKKAMRIEEAEIPRQQPSSHPNGTLFLTRL